MRSTPFGALVALAIASSMGCRLSTAGLGGDDVPFGDAAVDSGEDTSIDTDAACVEGEPCGPGLRCAGSVCCPRELACKGTCCPSGGACVLGRCEIPGASCRSDADCAADEMCDEGSAPPRADAACMPRDARCVPRPKACAGMPKDDCIAGCPAPLKGTFDPVLKYAWGGAVASPFGTDVISTPIVTQLDDDDCNGVVDARDRPDLLFVSFANSNLVTGGTLHALTVDKHAFVEKWSAPVPGDLLPFGLPAAGDLDGIPGAEVVACSQDGRAVAFSGAGKELFRTPAGACLAPVIYDLDGDGRPEIVTETAVYEGSTGALRFGLAPTAATPLTVADLDGDGSPEIVSGNHVWDSKGKRIADALATTVIGGALPIANYVALADLDLDGRPEIVATSWNERTFHVWRYDPSAPSGVTVVHRPTDATGGVAATPCAGSNGATHGGSPPVIADFDGDGRPDLAIGTGATLAVFSGKAILDPATPVPPLWTKPINACANAELGNAAFDFDGDGKIELASMDQQTIRIHRGSDGFVLFSSCNTSAGILDAPIVADVDSDGSADLVVPSNAYAFSCLDGKTKTAGLRVFGDDEGRWARARRVWNELDFHGTGTLDDGRVPKHPQASWLAGNDWRRMSIAGTGPDLVVSVQPICTGPYALAALVRNLGDAPFDGPAKVAFTISGTLVGTASTTRTILPGHAEWAILTLGSERTGDVIATVDVEPPARPWRVCRPENDRSPPTRCECP